MGQARELRELVDALVARSACQAEHFEGGTLLRVGALLPYAFQNPPDQPPRGAICGISRAARRRMLQTFGRLRSDAIARALFVTLTYPSSWPSLDRCRSDLEAWWKRVRRLHPGASAIWRMEPQDGKRGGEGRGAPHFHLVVFGVHFIDRWWLSESWFSVVGSGDELHLRAGTSIERVRSGRSVLGYIAKEMSGEKGSVFVDHETGSPIGRTGRCWGILGRADLPWGERRRAVLVGEAARDQALAIAAGVSGWEPARGWSAFQSLAIVTDRAPEGFDKIAANSAF